jgi:hypothetical protein
MPQSHDESPDYEIRRRLIHYYSNASLSAPAAIVLLAPLVVNLVYGRLRLIAAPTTFDYGPGFVAIEIKMWVQGGPLYRDFRMPPHLPLNFPPVFPVLAGLLSRVLGSQSMATLEAQRALVIFCSLLACLLIFGLSRRFGAGGGAAAIAAASFLASPVLQVLGFEGRVDMLALVCELAGLALFVRGLAYPAVALFVLSFLSKQMYADGIGAVLLYLLLNGNISRATVLGSVWFAAVAIATALLQVVYPYYWLNVWSSVSVVYDFSAPLAILGRVIVVEFPLAALAAVAALRDGPKRSLAVCYLIVACARDSASAVHWGSNVNYFLPTCAAATILAGAELERVLQGSRRLPVVAQVLLGAGITWIVGTQAAVLGPPSANWLNPDGVRALATIRGRVLTDLPELVLIGASPGIEAIELMPLNSMRAHGGFDDRPLMSAIEERQIAGFALSASLLHEGYRGRDLFWPELRQAIERNYYVANATGPPFILLPRQQ